MIAHLPTAVLRYMAINFLNNIDILNLRLTSKETFFKLANTMKRNSCDYSVELVDGEDVTNPELVFKGKFEKIVIGLPEPIIFNEEKQVVYDDYYSCGFDGNNFYSATFIDRWQTFASIQLTPSQLDNLKKMLFDYSTMEHSH